MSAPVPDLRTLRIPLSPTKTKEFVIDGTYAIDKESMTPEHHQAMADKLAWHGGANHLKAAERNMLIEQLIKDGRRPREAVRLGLTA